MTRQIQETLHGARLKCAQLLITAQLATTFVVLAASSACAQPEPTSAVGWLNSTFSDRVEALRSELIDVRRDIHRHPELSGQEERTANIVANRLREAGFEVRAGLGGHGVIGILRGATSGPILAFRADMDAVRSNEPDPSDFDSEIDGVRHICGHDIHTTIGLALAEGFAAVQNQLPGSVMLIFQPAEETATGAEAMLDDGAFDDPTPDAIFAYHTAPFEVGQVATASRTLMPGRDAVRVELSGSNELDSIARAVIDVINGAGTIAPQSATQSVQGEFVVVQGARTLRSRATGGVTVSATLTTSSTEASERARDAIEHGLSEIGQDDVAIELEYRERFIAGVTNQPELVEVANTSVRSVLGDDSVRMLSSMVPLFSEDFGSFQNEVPGVMYFLGVSNASKGWVGMPHSADYMADEEAIFVGAKTMAAVFFDLMERGLPDGIR